MSQLQNNINRNSTSPYESLNKDKKEHEQKEAKSQIAKKKIDELLNNTYVTIVFMTITLWALFADDVRVLSCNKSQDSAFYYVTSVVMLLFFIELILQSFCKQDYFLGFFFWLDLVSTLSLLMDIGFISEIILQQGNTNGGSAIQLAKAGRASRVGTRAARVVRIVRLIRLVKLYKHTKKMMDEKSAKIKAMKMQIHYDIPKDSGSNQANPPNLQDQIEEQNYFNNAQVEISNNIQNNIDLSDHPEDNKELHNELENSIKIQEKVDKNGLQGVNGKEEHDQANKNQEGNKVSNQEKQKNSNQLLEVKEKNQNFTPQKLTRNNKVHCQPQQGKIKLNQLSNNLKANLSVEVGNFIKNQKKETNAQIQHLQNQEKKQGSQQFGEDELKKSKSQKSEKENMETINEQFKETNVGKRLSDLTVQRLIIIVISIIFTVPLFNLDTYHTEYTSAESGLHFINQFISNQSDIRYQEALSSYTSFLTSSDIRAPLIQLYYTSNGQNQTLYKSDNVQVSQLRYVDIETYQAGNLVSIMDNTMNQKLNAIFGIIRTIFVCLVLSISSVYFSKDTNDLVVRPIEIMLEKVKKISNNPLEAAQIEEYEAFLKDQIRNDEQKQGNVSAKTEQKHKQKQEESTYETSILEKTIIKIGGLLALGFGEAGSGIIATNMAAGGEVNPMLPGKKTMAIFGFCDIRNFTDATEILQEDVMVFVNEIADITHGLVDQFCGAANKNIGDAFLLVWKYNNNMVTKDQVGNPKIISSRESQQFTDLALLAFLKIMAAIQLSTTLKKYRKHIQLNKVMPNYQVKMGFGLHCGLGIEGSIGSVYKIDASYLSPNVNMASRLEAATKQYGVPILISGELIASMTSKCAAECRLIDRVLIKGSQQMLDLYTCDCDLFNLEQKVKVGEIDRFKQDKMTREEKKTLKFKNRMKRDSFKKDILENNIDLHHQFFELDQEIYYMKQTFNLQFKKQYEQAFQHYLAGNWKLTKKLLYQVHYLHPQGKDGPSDTILKFVDQYNCQPPETWKGYRELIEK